MPDVPDVPDVTTERRSAAGGAAALRGRGGAGWTGPGYGRLRTCGPTAFDQANPAVASQFVDQVIAPRSDG